MTTRFCLNTNAQILAILVTTLFLNSCDGGGTQKRGANGDADAAQNAQATPVPSATPEGSASPSSSPATSAECETQWQQHYTYFKAGGKLTYNATLAYTLLGVSKTVPVIHTEEILASSDAEVDRKITITSTDPTVTTLLSLIKLAPSFPTRKATFLATCVKSANVATNMIAISGANIQVLENRDDAITVGGQQKTLHYMKLKGDITNALFKGMTADVQVWLSKETAGLVLKQISLLSNLPLVGTATLTDELGSSTGL